jgi:hypothetical protein
VRWRFFAHGAASNFGVDLISPQICSYACCHNLLLNRATYAGKHTAGVGDKKGPDSENWRIQIYETIEVSSGGSWPGPKGND